MAHLITIPEIRKELDVVDATRDPDLEELREKVEAGFERDTDRYFRRRVDDVFEVIVRRPGDRVNDRIRTIWGRLWPVEEIAIQEQNWGARVDWDEVDELDASKYYIETDDVGIIRDGGCWGDIVRITVTGGFVEAAVSGHPEQIVCTSDIKDALLKQLQYRKTRFAGASIAMSQQGTQDSTTTWITGDMAPIYESVVAKYRRLRV